MRRTYRTMALSAVALGLLLSAGCGPSTTNDENLTGNRPTGGGVGPVKYGDFAKKQAEKDAQAREDARKNKGKAAPKAEPETPKESPKEAAKSQ